MVCTKFEIASSLDALVAQFPVLPGDHCWTKTDFASDEIYIYV